LKKLEEVKDMETNEIIGVNNFDGGLQK